MKEKMFQGAPFGSQSVRFDVSKAYPANKRVETCTHNPKFRETFSDLHTMVGPGMYKIPSFIEELEKKPGSLRGICETRDKRFKDYQSSNPAPGTYGKGGIPSAALEEKQRIPVGTCPSMGLAKQHRFKLNTEDSGLGPGTYNLKSSTELILNRRVSKRGPYDLTTGTVNVFAGPKGVSPDPGTYPKELPRFDAELQKPEKRKHGMFGSKDQYPAVPTERIYLATLPQCPRPATSPGPGWYNHIPITPTHQVRKGKQAPFLSSAPRMGKRTQMLMNKNYNLVGPGRYNIVELSQNTNSHRSAFLSGTQRYLHSLERDKYIQERLKPMNVPLAQRPFQKPEICFK